MSSIPAVLNALVALYTANMTDAQVILGPPSAATGKANKVVAVGGVKGIDDKDSMGGRSDLDVYDVEVIFSVAYSAGDMAKPLTDVDNLWTTGRNLIRLHATQDLGVPGVLQVSAIGEFELTEYAEDSTRSAAVRSSVRVWAQLT